MKDGIHPKVYNAKITCACGFQLKPFPLRAKMCMWKSAPTAIPSSPASSVFVDTAGRIDRFRKKYAKFEK